MSEDTECWSWQESIPSKAKSKAKMIQHFQREGSLIMKLKEDFWCRAEECFITGTMDECLKAAETLEKLNELLLQGRQVLQLEESSENVGSSHVEAEKAGTNATTGGGAMGPPGLTTGMLKANNYGSKSTRNNSNKKNTTQNNKNNRFSSPVPTNVVVTTASKPDKNSTAQKKEAVDDTNNPANVNYVGVSAQKKAEMDLGWRRSKDQLMDEQSHDSGNMMPTPTDKKLLMHSPPPMLPPEMPAPPNFYAPPSQSPNNMNIPNMPAVLPPNAGDV